MNDQKVRRKQSGFKIDFSNEFFDEESIKIRKENIRKIAASRKTALDFSDECTSKGFSIVPF